MKNIEREREVEQKGGSTPRIRNLSTFMQVHQYGTESPDLLLLMTSLLLLSGSPFCCVDSLSAYISSFSFFFSLSFSIPSSFYPPLSLYILLTLPSIPSCPPYYLLIPYTLPSQLHFSCTTSNSLLILGWDISTYTDTSLLKCMHIDIEKCEHAHKYILTH